MLVHPSSSSSSIHQDHQSSSSWQRSSSSSSTSMSLSKSRAVTTKRTKLFELLAQKHFTQATTRIQRRPREASIWTEYSSSLLLPLHMALLQKAPIETIEKCIQANVAALTETDSFGMTPLHIACQAGVQLDIVKMLVASPLCCRVVDESGRTPLHLACVSHALRPNVITYLLERFPEAVKVRDSKGFCPAEYIGPHPHQKLLQKEMKRGSDYWRASKEPNTFIRSLWKRDWKKVFHALNNENINTSEWTMVKGQRYLPLHLACQRKAPVAVVEMLIESYPEALELPCQAFNMLPLHMACQYGASAATVLCLLKSFPKAASVADAHGLLPIHLACTEGASAIVVQAFMKEYPEANRIKDLRGFIPLDYAKVSSHPHAIEVKELLEKSPATRRPSHEEDTEGPRVPQRMTIGEDSVVLLSPNQRKQSLGLLSRGSSH